MVLTVAFVGTIVGIASLALIALLTKLRHIRMLGDPVPAGNIPALQLVLTSRAWRTTGGTSRAWRATADDEVVTEVALQLGFVRGYALSCGVRREHLDDFVQDVALTAIKRIDEGAFRPDPEKPLRDAVRVWLTGIVWFKAADLGRALATRARLLAPGPTSENPIDPDVAVPSPEAQIAAREELDAIDRLKMSSKQREAVTLAAEGYTAREIGERLGIPEDTAATYIKRTRKAYEQARTRRSLRRGIV